MDFYATLFLTYDVYIILLIFHYRKNGMKNIQENLEEEIVQLRKRVAELEELHYQSLQGKSAQDVVHEAYAYTQSIVRAVREPLIVLDSDLRVISANQSFYETFHVDAHETEKNFIYNLGNGQWNIPALRNLLNELLNEKDAFSNYEIRHTFEIIGQKIMLVNARRIPPIPERAQFILLAIEDVTERNTSRIEIATGKEVTAGLEEKVLERTRQLNAINSQLQEKVAELEVFNKAAVGRELKMIALKDEILRLQEKLISK